jgi:hypothetical protein
MLCSGEERLNHARRYWPNIPAGQVFSTPAQALLGLGARAAAFLRLRYRARRLRFSILLYCLPIYLYFPEAIQLFCGTMKFPQPRFNCYFLLLVLALSAGCKTAEERSRDKTISTFRLHLEGSPGSGESTAIIQIAGVELYVNNAPFLDETSVTNAAVVDTRDGGFAIRVQYDPHGTLILDTVTAQYHGRRIAIFAQYGRGKLEHSRWLAAPYGSPITDGVLIFTPLATREESEEIVLGLNNVTRKIRKRSAF